MKLGKYYFYLTFVHSDYVNYIHKDYFAFCNLLNFFVCLYLFIFFFYRVHSCLLNNIKRIQSQLRDEKSNAAWSWDFMCRIQAAIVNCAEKISIDSTTLLCDVLFLSLIIMACGDCLVYNDEQLITTFNTRAELFPYALARLASLAHWKDKIQQVI